MTPETVSFSVIASFLVILLIGFLFGLARGFNKSLVRAIIVIACLVITFFIVPSITNSVMNANISNFNITINGEVMTSVGEILTVSLSNLPMVADLVGTQAFATIINVVPQMIVNVVLFIVLFYLIRMVSMIIYWIIAGICFSKKKTKGKNKHRVLGGLVGIVQNFVIFLVLLVPCVGVINLVGDVEATIPKQTTSAPATATATTEGEQPANPEQSGGSGSGSSSSTDVTGTITKTLETAGEYIDAYQNTWVLKMLHGVRLDSACNYVFNKLSTVKVKKESYNLHDEVVNISRLVVDFTGMKVGEGQEFSFTNTETLEKLETLINDAYKSKLTANLIDEVIPTAVEKWNKGESFMGIKKPTMEGYEKVINDILVKLGEPGSKKQLLLSTAKMAKSLVSTANKLTNASGELKLDDVATLLKDITNDPMVMDLAKTIVVENIDDIANKLMGDQNNAYVGVVVEAVEGIFGADYSLAENNLDKEINVLSSTLSFADKLNKDDQTIEQTDVNNVVNSLVDSTVIFNTITTIKDNQSTSDIATTLQDLINKDTSGIKDKIETALSGVSADKADKVAKLREVFFGTTTTTPTTPTTPEAPEVTQ